MLDKLIINGTIIDGSGRPAYSGAVGMKDGKFIVNDPNSPENSEKLWSYEQIQGQIRNLWVIR